MYLRMMPESSVQQTETSNIIIPILVVKVERNSVSTGCSYCESEGSRVSASLATLPAHTQKQFSSPPSPGLISIPPGHLSRSPGSTAILHPLTARCYLVTGHCTQLSCDILSGFRPISFLVFPAHKALQIANACLILHSPPCIPSNFKNDVCMLIFLSYHLNF